MPTIDDSRALALVAAISVLLHVSSATYSCCSEERRGTVCTLAGNGNQNSVDSSNASTAAFVLPVGIALYPPSSIVVSGRMEHRLRVIHHNGTVSTLAGGGPIGEIAGSYVDSDDPLAARFWKPEGVCAHSEGSILICDESNHRIRTILRNGSVRTLAGSGTTGYNNGGYADNADPLQARFFHPHGIVSFVENGQRLIVIGGHYDQRVRVICANMTVATLAGSVGTNEPNCGFKDSADPLTARFCFPLGVAPDRFGNIIVADHRGNRIRKVWRDGSQSGVTTIAGHGPSGSTDGSSIDSDNPLEASFFSPGGVTIDSSGSILVSTLYEHRIRIIFPNGSVRTLAGSGPTSGLSPSTPGGFADNAPLLRARFDGPSYLTINPHGDIILTDYNNHRVRTLCAQLAAEPAPSMSLSPTPDTFSGTATLLSHASSTYAASQTASHRSEESHTAATHSHTHSSPNVSSSSTHSLRLLSPTAATPNPISRLVSSEEAAWAIVVSGTGAAALAGIAATTSMGHATRMGALMRSVECAFATGELDPPSLVELPLQWSMESQGGSVGSHAGSALLTSVVLVSERPTLRWLQSSVLSRYCLLSVAFFAPNVLMSSVVVVGRGASSGAVEAAIFAAIVPLLLGCVAGQRALAMDVEVVPLCGGKWELRNRPSSRAYVETFGGLVEGCRDPTPYFVRVCFLVLRTAAGVPVDAASLFR